MKQILTSEGMKSLRTAWLLLAVSAIAGAGIVWGSHWYYEKEKGDRVISERRLKEARARLGGAQRERDSQQEAADTFRGLGDRGLLQNERRLDLVEFINQLRLRHQLSSLDYEILPRRPLQLSGGRSFTAVEVLASRVKLKARALHEGDIVGFVDALSKAQRGFYPVDRCQLRRVESFVPDSVQPRVEADCALEWITLKEKRANS